MVSFVNRLMELPPASSSSGHQGFAYSKAPGRIQRRESKTPGGEPLRSRRVVYRVQPALSGRFLVLAKAP